MYALAPPVTYGAHDHHRTLPLAPSVASAVTEMVPVEAHRSARLRNVGSRRCRALVSYDVNGFAGMAPTAH